MDKLIAITILLLITFSCKKETKQPQQVQPSTSKVWCFYQTNFGNKAFLYCAKSELEMQQKQQEYINAQLQIAIEEKTNCNLCQ